MKNISTLWTAFTLLVLMPTARAESVKNELINPENSKKDSTEQLTWEPIDESEINKFTIEWEAVRDNYNHDENRNSPVSKGSKTKIISTDINQAVTGGAFHIKRNGEFLPAITHFIPSGYGASFGNISLGLWLEDCLTAGGKLCGGSDSNFKRGGQSWIDEFNDWGKGRVVIEAGLGDPNKWIGLDVGYQFTSLATSRPGQSNDGTPFGSGRGLDVALSKNISQDWGVKVGARNIAKFDKIQLDSGRSAFMVTTKRIDLGGNINDNSNDLYVTLGLGNGRMRPLRAIVEDQKRECQKDVRKYGRRTKGPYVVHCLERGFDYGTPWPIASVAYVANERFSLIAEWWGRNLLLGTSIKPLVDINWVITPAVTSIVHNSDWDPSVPGYTNRVRFNLSTSVGF